MTLRLQLCCSRCLDTSRFLTSCQQTLCLRLCRNPSRGLDARRLFLACGLLTLRLQLCRCQSRGFLAFSLQSRGLDASRFLTRGLLTLRLQLCRCQSRGLLAFSLQSLGLDARRFFLTSGLQFRGLNPRRLQPIRLFGQFSGSLLNVLADSLPC